MTRSIMAIVVGFVLIAALSFGADFVLRSAIPGAFPPGGKVVSTHVLLLMTVYVAVFAIFGCWVTARLAPDHPMRHALILGLLGLLFIVYTAVTQWQLTPPWFHIVAIVLVMPYAWIGGWLAERQRRGAATTAAA